MTREVRFPRLLFFLITLAFGISACGQVKQATILTRNADRISNIPTSAVKSTLSGDFWPPTAASGWSQPEPMAGPVNTAGAEDSPFITQDGNDLYFFFTPDARVPVQSQLLDGVTGIWVAHRNGAAWSEPERVLLSDPVKLALDGCEFVAGNLMLFCTVREGYNGLQWFSAKFQNGTWQDWQYAGDQLKQNEYQVGELDITADGQELYYHSPRLGGFGGLDIWVSQKTSSGWGQPKNLGPSVNTSADEGWPFVSSDGKELWFNGQSLKGRPGPTVFHSIRQADGTWGLAEEIISTFAGEPTLSRDGKTLYFVHHFYSQDMSTMLEADIYVSNRLEP